MAKKTITIREITSKLAEFNTKHGTPTDMMEIMMLDELGLLPAEVADWCSSTKDLEIVGWTPTWITNF